MSQWIVACGGATLRQALSHLCIVALALSAPVVADEALPLWDLSDPAILDGLGDDAVSVDTAPGPQDKAQAIVAEFHPVSKWPGFDLSLPGVCNWAPYDYLSLLVYNEEDHAVSLAVNIHDADGKTYSPARKLPAKTWTEYRIPVAHMSDGYDYGRWCGTAIDITRVTRLTPFLHDPAADRRVRFARIAICRSVPLPAPCLEARGAADGVALSWDRVEDAVAYDIFRRTDQTRETRIARFCAPRFVDVSAQPGERYTYQVAAVDSLLKVGHKSRSVRSRRDGAAGPALPPTGRYGGRADIRLARTGFFRTEILDGRWRLVDPDGHPLFSIGICGVVLGDTFTRVTRREHLFADILAEKDDPAFRDAWSPWWGHEAYGLDKDGLVVSRYVRNQIVKHGQDWYPRWRARSLKRLADWHVNTLAAWAHGPVIQGARMPYVSFGASWRGCPKIPDINLPDVFDPAFEEKVAASARQAADAKADPYLIGRFTDNELAWHGDWQHGKSVVSLIQMAPDDLAARKAWLEFVRERYDSVTDLNGAWKTQFAGFEALGAWRDKIPDTIPARADAEAFLEEFAGRYFRITSEALRDSDPNHLVLGARHSQSAPAPVLRANSRYADAISVTLYGWLPGIQVVPGGIHTDKPWLVGEFHFISADSPLPVRAADCVTPDQATRGEAYQNYVAEALSLPNLIGVHWFEYVDEPATGRFNFGKDGGEAHNIGWVDVNDEPYTQFVSRAALINANAPLALR